MSHWRPYQSLLSFQPFCLVISLILDYSLNFPYGHLYITGSLFGARNAKNHTFPTVPRYNMDTSARWTLGSVPLVSVLKRFDCIWKATKLQSLLSWYVVFPPLFLKKGQVNYLNSKGIKAANLDEGQLCKWHLEIHVVSFISNHASLGSWS